MLSKKVPSQRVMFVETTLAIRDIGSFGEQTCPKLLEEIERCGLTQAGDWIYISKNLPTNGKDLFHFELCLPIEGTASSEPIFPIKTLEEFHCGYREYSGKLRFLFSQGYAPIVQELRSGKIPTTGESREVYLNWVGPKSAENRIEIQFGLA